MRKKVDERIRTLIENGVKANHRSMFVVIGDKHRDQIVHLHSMMRKSTVKPSSKVLWCYKDKLELSSHRKKREKQVKKLKQAGLLDPEKLDPFSLFMESNSITHCMYRDSERVLGNTFGMCVLQDFEALTPNLLARTIETVEGGGLIILVLRSLSSLTSLCTMVMDVHERFRTESHNQASGRFNERFLLSLASCKACIVMDDELNILPISSHMKTIIPFPVQEDSEGLSEDGRKLKELKEELKDCSPIGPLLKKCCTWDQGNAVTNFIDAVLDRNIRSTVALLAPRGRGKSAALGLAISGAVDVGYSNTFVTAPSPENLNTLFEFICKGLDMLGYKEHLDYNVVKSANPDFKKATVRININKHHRQTVQYMQPHECEKLSSPVELLVIDEAAAIPLPVVKSMLGPYLVFLSSTVNGYEGTGRSLSLKLLEQLEEQSQTSTKSTEVAASGGLFKKIELSESIRYASGDPIESWLNSLLCLDVTNYIPRISSLPSTDDCRLFYVNRDTLFSCDATSELFLKRMMALFVASHYKNSPNDLQLMADAPAHHLFVLLGPVDESESKIPDILCAIQICFEGQISRKSAMKSLNNGHQPSGDQIPWKFCELFRDTVFPSLSGARIVRIATHPGAMRLGYGSAAVELLARYFEGQLTQISELEEDEEIPENTQTRVIEAAEKASLLEENIKSKTDLPPLLTPVQERRPEKLHYLGVSFGLTLDLFRFWRKHNFAPFYVGCVASKMTGEYTCMVLRRLNNSDIETNGSDQLGFVSTFYQEFRRRFVEYLTGSFHLMEYKLAMSLLDPKINFSGSDSTLPSTSEYINSIMKILPSSMERLEAYTNNLVDFHMIEDFTSHLARSYFWGEIPVTLSYAQASVLLCLGLQRKDISYIIEKNMNVERHQILSVYMKVMRKFYNYLNVIASKETRSIASRLDDIAMEPHPVPLDEDLEAGANEVQDNMRVETADNMLDVGPLQQYAILDKDEEFEKTLKSSGGRVIHGGTVSIKSNKSVVEKKHGKKEKQKSEKSNKKNDQSSKTKKRRMS